MKKLLFVSASFALVAAIAGTATYGYLRWRDPIGFRNLKACKTIKPGVSLAELKAVLGEPVATSTSRGTTWLYFRTASIAAGQIRASVQPSTSKVVALRCSEDGPDTWSAAGRAASNLRIQRSAPRAAADPGC